MAEKPARNQQIHEVEKCVGGALRFKVPQPGHLVVAELSKLPCYPKMREIRRVYLWSPSDPELGELPKWYGNHAHTHGQEIFVCLMGMVEVEISDGHSVQNMLLARGDALFLPTMVWHSVRGGEMMVLADTDYDREEHYVEDYKQFCLGVTADKAFWPNK